MKGNKAYSSLSSTSRAQPGSTTKFFHSRIMPVTYIAVSVVQHYYSISKINIGGFFLKAIQNTISHMVIFMSKNPDIQEQISTFSIL